MNDQAFTLTNEGAPAFSHPDLDAFKPMTNSMKTRQAIYNLLQSAPGTEFTLLEIQAKVKELRQAVRSASKQLVRKGLARKVDILEPRPTKKRPDATIKSFALSFIPPWSSKKTSAW